MYMSLNARACIAWNVSSIRAPDAVPRVYLYPELLAVFINGKPIAYLNPLPDSIPYTCNL